MRAVILLLTLALALAGCTSETTSEPTPTTTTAGTPTPAVSTPATASPTPPTGEAPAPMQCEGDYITDDATGTRLGMPELNFTIQEPSDADPCYAFIGPGNATSGWNVISLTQTAMEFHIMPMLYIGDHAVEELMGAFAASEDGQPPSWAIPSGAVGAVTPGQTGRVAIDLQPGTYVYFCPIGGHMFQGMLGAIHVTQATTEAAPPTADAEISLVDYNFTLPASIGANVSVIKVTNNGSEPHEAPLVLLQGNATLMEFLAAVESENPTGPPPGALVGGVNMIAPGQSVYVLVTLATGEHYGLACFVESPTHGGAAHLELGMMADFTVS